MTVIRTLIPFYFASILCVSGSMAVQPTNDRVQTTEWLEQQILDPDKLAKLGSSGSE